MKLTQPRFELFEALVADDGEIAVQALGRARNTPESRRLLVRLLVRLFVAPGGLEDLSALRALVFRHVPHSRSSRTTSHGSSPRHSTPSAASSTVSR